MVRWFRSRQRPPTAPQWPALPGPTEVRDPLNSGAGAYEYRGVPTPSREPGSEAGSFSAISEHVERYLAPHSHVLHELVSDHVHLDVIPAPPSGTHRAWTFITSGMSDLPMSPPAGASQCRFAELLVRLPPNWPAPAADMGDLTVWKDERFYWPICLLKALARFPHLNRTWLWTGHSIPIHVGLDLPPGIRFTDVVLIPPVSLPKDFWTLDVAPGKTIHFFNILPLYPEEVEYKRRQGFDALLDLLPAPDTIEVIDPGRPSLLRS